MKSIYLFIIGLLPYCINAQTISPQVIAIAGETSNPKLVWTLGEISTETLIPTNQNPIITQGFHQPENINREEPPPIAEEGEPNCNNIQYDGSKGQIKISGLNAPKEKIEIYDPSWSKVFECDGNCENPQIVPNINSGNYNVKVKLLAENGSWICATEENVSVTNNSSSSRASSMLGFTAFRKQFQTELQWAVNVNQTADQFIIEKSKDGIHFEFFKQVSSSPTAGVHTYKNWDKAPWEGNNYYRIKWEGSSNEPIYSATINVPFDGLFSITVFPNPAKEQIFVRLNDFIGASIQLKIFNALGHEVYQEKRSNSKEKLIAIPISDYQNGLYMLSVIGKGRSSSKKFMIEQFK